MAKKTALFYYRILRENGAEVYPDSRIFTVRLDASLVISDFLEKVYTLNKDDLGQLSLNRIKAYERVDGIEDLNGFLETDISLKGLGSKKDPLIIILPMTERKTNDVKPNPDFIRLVEKEPEIRERIQALVNAKLDLPVEAVDEYIKFLKLKFYKQDFNAEQLSPSTMIDEIWHLHVLDTKNYAADCIDLFGAIIHHDPLGDQNKELRDKRYNKTIKMYEPHFGYIGDRFYFWRIIQRGC